MARPCHGELRGRARSAQAVCSPGTSLDSFQGKTYISLVGFRFCRTRLLGRLAIPFHTNFDEVNLRFYVRRRDGGEDRRGVVFISEVVHRRAIATTARLLYGENYTCLPMRHRVERDEMGKTLAYQWKIDGKWCGLSARTVGLPTHPGEGSLEQFITEHYWGYSNQQTGDCLEYYVEHAPWRVWTTTAAGFDGEGSALYGPRLATVLRRPPDRAFVADGSPVTVFRGNRIL
jgi:hypothetical protein